MEQQWRGGSRCWLNDPAGACLVQAGPGQVTRSPLLGLGVARKAGEGPPVGENMIHVPKSGHPGELQASTFL